LQSHSAIHCDTEPRNFFLDGKLDVKIADFSGSCLKGSRAHAWESLRHYLPWDCREPSDATTDLFPLGSVIYKILAGASPYDELARDEAETLYQEKRFPDLSGLPCGEVVINCWLGRFEPAQQVYDPIKPFR
jgi:serine/threonine protein kinase